MNSSFGSSRVGGNSVHSAFGVFPSVSPNLGFAFSIYPRTMPGIYVNHQVNNFIIKSASTLELHTILMMINTI